MLEFKKFARKEFSFLETDYHFNIIDRYEYSLDYETSDVTLSIIYDQYTHELDIYIGYNKLIQNGNIITFCIEEILGYKNAIERQLLFQADNQQALQKLIKELAILYKKYAKDLLLANVAEFKNLLEYRNKVSQEYALSKELKLMRRNADKAWNEKTFTKIVELYSGFEPYLTESEKQKLEYARKFSSFN